MSSSQRLSSAISQVAKSSAHPYICASCRSQTQLVPRTVTSQQTRHNSDLPFTEKLRRKIWGTDNPPGLKDPYGGPSFLERRLAQRKQQKAEEAEARALGGRKQAQVVEEEIEPIEKVPVEVLPASKEQSPEGALSTPEPYVYQEAETWHGLEWVGHRGVYRHMEPQKEDTYTPWLKIERTNQSRTKLWEVLHESIFDATQPPNEPYDTQFRFTMSTDGGFVSNSASSPAPADDAGMAWRSFGNATVSFTKPETFKILKNFQLLTSKRLPDPFLNSLARQHGLTWRTFIDTVVKHWSVREDAKVNDHLRANKALQVLPNVTVMRRKELPWQKEQKLGRLKVIERELEKRDLPALSPRAHDRRKKGIPLFEAAAYSEAEIERIREGKRHRAEEHRQRRLAKDSMAQIPGYAKKQAAKTAAEQQYVEDYQAYDVGADVDDQPLSQARL